MEAIDSGRLHFAVSNFRQLQGLRQAAMGAFALVVFFPFLRQGNLTYIGIVVIPAFIGLIYSLSRIDAYYERRIGHIEQRPPGTGRAVLGILFNSVIPLCLHPGSLESTGAYMKGFNGEWWCGCMFLGVAILTRRRWYYLPFAALLLALGAGKSTTGSIETMGRIDEWFLIVFGMTLIATGVADHFYLIHTFPRPREDSDV